MAHPDHYQMGGIEVIDAIEAWGFGEGFNRGNAIKYIARAGRKNPLKEVEDLKKARRGGLFVEQVCVGAGGDGGQDQDIFTDLVHQQPVGFDVAFPEIGQIAGQGMVAILLRKLDALGEKVQNRFELFQILATALHTPDIPLHAVGVDDLQHGQ